MGHHIVRRPKATPDKYYIDPEQLKSAIIEMQSKGTGMSEEFAKMLLLIQEKVLLFPRFASYPDVVKAELRSFNQLRWVRSGWRLIKADKNPFAYITTACSLNFLTALEKYFKQEERQQRIKDEATELLAGYIEQEKRDSALYDNVDLG